MNHDFKTSITLLYASRRIPLLSGTIDLLNRILEAIHDRIMTVVSEMMTFDMDIIIESVFPEDIRSNLHRVLRWDKTIHFNGTLYPELNVIYEYLMHDIIDRTVYKEFVTPENIKSTFDHDTGLKRLLYENRIVLLDPPGTRSVEKFTKGMKDYIKENPHVFNELNVL